MGRITIQDSNLDGQIQAAEWNRAKWGLDPDEGHEVYFNGRLIESGTLTELEGSMGRHFAQSADTRTLREEAGKKVETLSNLIDQSMLALEQAKAEANNAKEKQAQQQLQALIQEYETAARTARLSKSDMLNLTSLKQAAGMSTRNAKATISTRSGNATTRSGRGPKAQGVGAQTAGGTAFYPPAGWGAQTATTFNSSAYMKSMVMEDNVMKAHDAINRNTNRGKQLMMLFFYFARMAESGDMGAMYQFMKFITYIISKDKAKQQIEMGKKLIQLQELSRKWTSKLLNLQTNSADPAASNELMKMMTIVKGETDSIATSQKLISQMMEEFAQVVESLTNSTKAALDAYGRILRTVSSVR